MLRRPQTRVRSGSAVAGALAAVVWALEVVFVLYVREVTGSSELLTPALLVLGCGPVAAVVARDRAWLALLVSAAAAPVLTVGVVGLFVAGL